jgi:hypothetical protein
VIRREAIAARGGLVAAELEAEAIPTDLDSYPRPLGTPEGFLLLPSER